MKLIGLNPYVPPHPAYRLILLLSALVSVSTVDAADRIVLRNLKIISDRSVAGFDVDGVRLDDGSVLGWDAIERAKLQPDHQAAFDQLLADLGDSLYRIRQRLSVGDDEGLLPYAEQLAPQYQDFSSPTGYMVQQARMWGLLASGKREQALEPYLRCYEYLRQQPKRADSLPGKRRLTYDPRTGLSPELPAVWFDPAAAREVRSDVYTTIRGMRRPLPGGVYIYYASLLQSAGDHAEATRILEAIKSTNTRLLQLREILTAQNELLAHKPEAAITRLDRCMKGIDTANRPLALYWSGVGKTQMKEEAIRRRGLLDLLRVPALFGENHPELSAAALYQAHQVLAEMKEPRGSVTVREELLRRYGQTYFAARIRSLVRPEEDEEETP